MPEGFDPERVAALKQSLAHKRSHSAADAWPALARSLGVHFAPLFSEHVAPLPLAGDHGPLLDGLRLAEVLEQEGRLDSPSAAALASVRLRYRREGHTLLPRFGLTVSRARASTGMAVALKIPGLGQRLFWLRR